MCIRWSLLSINCIQFQCTVLIILACIYSGDSRQAGAGSSSGSGVTIQNALIGQQDMTKFYNTSTTQRIFQTVSKLCEIGKDEQNLLVILLPPSHSYSYFIVPDLISYILKPHYIIKYLQTILQLNVTSIKFPILQKNFKS